MADITREQWMIATALGGAINAANAPFCVGEGETVAKVAEDPGYVDAVAGRLAELCGRMALEDTMQLVQTALSKLE